jgi:hypothetical protein
LSKIKPAIFDHPEFTAFNQRATAHSTLAQDERPCSPASDRPQVLIEALSVNLLEPAGAHQRGH